MAKKLKAVEQDKALTVSFTMRPLMARVVLKKAEKHYGSRAKIPPLMQAVFEAWIFGCRKTRLTFSRLPSESALGVDAAREFSAILTACVEETGTVGPSTKSALYWRRTTLDCWLKIDTITAIGSLEDA